MVGKRDQFGEERRVLPCTEKPLAHTLIPLTTFSVAQLRPSTLSPQVQI